MPENPWWDIHVLHDMTQIFPHEPYAAAEVIQSPATTCQDEASEEPESLAASDTQTFKITVQANISAANRQFPFGIASDVTPQDLNMLWNRDFHFATKEGILCLHATNFPTPMSLEHRLATVFIEGRMTVYACATPDVGMFCEDIMGEGPWIDQFGSRFPGAQFHQSMAISRTPQTHQVASTDPAILLAAFKNCVIVYKYFLESDTWCVEITGEATARQVIATTMHEAISKDTLCMMGRAVSIEHDPHCNMTRVLFKPACQGTPLPPTLLAMCLAVGLTRSVFDSRQSDNGMAIQLKWLSRVLWQGQIDSELTAEVVQTLLTYTLSPNMLVREVRLVHKG